MRGEAASATSLGLAAADSYWAAGSVANLSRLAFDPSLVARSFPPPHTVGTLIEILQALGCDVDLRDVACGDLARVPMPCLCLLAGEGADDGDVGPSVRPCLVVRVEADRIMFFAAGVNAPTVEALSGFAQRYVGMALVTKRAVRALTDDAEHRRRAFGFRWFVPELLKHRSTWRDVLAASLAIQLLALALPLLSQVVIDKVIVHRATSTLVVISAALATLIVFSAALSWVRQYLVIHTGNRVDAVLGATVFRHLFALPLRYYERRPTGVLTARLAGIETIREFLSGAAVTLALDVPFLIVFLAVMLLYSVPLTLLTLAFIASIALISALAAPVLQRRFDAQFLASARSQAFVTEHVAAVETVKSLQLEPELANRYDDLLARHLDAGFRTRQTANTYQTLASALEQLLSASILCAGAWIVMGSASFTIGMLVAFQMFASRVAQPLLRLVGLWQQFQQAAIAVRRLADVMDVPAESRTIAPARAAGPAGRIELVDVAFRYSSDAPWLYRGLRAEIEPGECVVVTGPSGCGKSTLIKLLLGFALPEEGAVRVHGRDTRAYATNELRARFGVVPQETALFSGTLLDNLQLGNPAVSFEQVVHACRIAEIHGAIESLPAGYRTEVGERGVGLSGGQKQRLSLARALLRRPQVLLLDEPFSQLDDESATRIAGALSRLKGKLTIIVVSHQVPPALGWDRRIDLAAACPGRMAE